ncbi:MAG: hypothetical protein K1X74_06885 [Pirellulales bacterium]|nr:hypothetical protein [Pirellulales bacterium]
MAELGADILASLMSLVERDAWQLFAWNCLWQSTVVCLIGLAVERLCRKQSGAWRAEVCLATVCLAVVTPLLTTALRSTRHEITWSLPHAWSTALPVPEAATGSVAYSRSMPGASTAGAKPAPVAATHPTLRSLFVPQGELPDSEPFADQATADTAALNAEPARVPRHVPAASSLDDTALLPEFTSAAQLESLAEHDSRLLPNPWLVTAMGWVLLVGWRFARIAHDVQTLARLRRRSLYDVPAKITAEFNRAAAALRFAGRFQVRHSSDIKVPTLSGIRRPVVLIPTQAPRNADWYQVACHELAHAQRRDNLAQASFQLALLVLPWQPLLYVVRRAFLVAAEQAADHRAVRGGIHPVDLAEQLTMWLAATGNARSPGTAMAHRHPSTRRRIMDLLALPPENCPQAMRPVMHWFVLASALLLCLALSTLRINAEETAPPSTGGANRPAPVIAVAPPVSEVATDEERQPRSNDEINAAIVERDAFRLGPGDRLRIDVRLTPRDERMLQPGDVVHVSVSNTLASEPVEGPYVVAFDHSLHFNASYGAVDVKGKNLAAARDAAASHFKSMLGDSELQMYYAPAAFTLNALVDSAPRSIQDDKQPREPTWRVAPDGTLKIPRFGSFAVIGKTLAQVEQAIAIRCEEQGFDARVEVILDDMGQHYCFVGVMDQPGTVKRRPLHGGETVLDMLTDQDAGISALLSEGAVVEYIGRAPVGVANQIVLTLNAIIRDSSGEQNPRVHHGDRILLRPLEQRKTGSGQF